MKLSFLIGLAVAIVALLMGFILNNYSISLKITGTVAVGSLILSGILNGSFINGDAYRVNYLSETKEDRDKKGRIIKYLLLLSIPNAIESLILILN